MDAKSTNGPTGYRADIDGLRAVAVVAVVLFHADIVGFGGGFVGVDVFFVISGFLITKIILSDIEKDRFSITRFYERRVRRIFPALFAMMLAAALAGGWLLLPSDFSDLGNSAIATTLFSSNFFFWKQSSYFAAPSELSPLLHTWSLAVEEQFYVLYPIALMLLMRYMRRWVSGIIIVSLIISLLVSIWAVKTHSVAAFYLAPTRAWELLAGSILAFNCIPAIGSQRLRSSVSVAGIALIIWGVLVFSSETPFPGAAAVLPILGTVLVIHAGTHGLTFVNRLLSLRPVVFVGLISYSLYLWHWPIFVLLKQYYAVLDLSPQATLLALTGSIFAAVVSWRFVERPFRLPHLVPRRPVFTGAAVVAAAMIVFGAGVAVTKGLPGRFDARIIQIADTEKDVSIKANACLKQTPDDARVGQLCQMGAGGDKVATFLLWGDSHAAAIMPAIHEAADQLGKSGLFAGKSGCVPLTGVSRVQVGNRCIDFNGAVLDFLRASKEIDTVVLAARWAIYAEGYRNRQEPGGRILIADAESIVTGVDDNRAVFARGFQRLLSDLQDLGKKVIIVGPVPEVGLNVPKALAMRLRTGLERPIEPKLTDFLRRQGYVMQTLNEAATQYGTELIFPHKSLCDDQVCRVENEGIPLYVDDDHLTLSASVKLQKIFLPVFR